MQTNKSGYPEVLFRWIGTRSYLLFRNMAGPLRYYWVPVPGTVPYLKAKIASFSLLVVFWLDEKREGKNSG
jgi:hypothetical protein